MSKQEEWDIFSRTEQLEKVTTKFMDTETTLLESRLIALWAFSLAFAALTEHRPDVARQFKDVLMTQLKGAGLRQKALNALEEWMLYFCDVLERENRVHCSPGFHWIELLGYLLGSPYSLNYSAQPQAIPNLTEVVDRLNIINNT